MENKIVKFDTPEIRAIEKSKAEQIKATFEPMAEMLLEFEEAYNDTISKSKKEITKDLTIRAKWLRLDIAKVRVQTEKIRKEQKEEYLRAGKAIDGVSNILKWAISDKESKLKEIENHFEIQEQKRIQALQSEREEKLSIYVEDAHERKLYEMDEDVWNAYIQTKKKEYEDRIGAEKKAEEVRIAKIKEVENERKRIKKENEILKEEASERKRLAELVAIKMAKEEAERNAKEAAERKLREEKEKIQQEAHQAQLRYEREEKERIEREERSKREKLETELNDRKEKERRAQEDEKAIIQLELNKGDAEKIKDLVADLEALKTKYNFQSDKYKIMYSSVCLRITKCIDIIKY